MAESPEGQGNLYQIGKPVFFCFLVFFLSRELCLAIDWQWCGRDGRQDEKLGVHVK